IYSHKFPENDDQLTNDVFKQIAIAAAIWHDVVQKDNSPINEIESAKEFSNCFQVILNKFIREFPQCKNTVQQFLLNINFIANELIVYDTWLIFGSNGSEDISVKTLRQHANIAESNGIQIQYEKNPMFMRLAYAADAIST